MLCSGRQGLELHALDPAAQKWDAARPITAVPKEWWRHSIASHRVASRGIIV